MWFQPLWPASDWVIAGTSSRLGGMSAAPYHGLNLATHVGDDPHRVGANREKFTRVLGLPGELCWLNQVHGQQLVSASHCQPGMAADGIYTVKKRQVCSVMTADCLPVLLTDSMGTMVAAAHAGWRGLYAGILEQAVKLFLCKPENLWVWFGPAIGSRNYVVGGELKDKFIKKNAEFADCFTKNQQQLGYHADLYAIAKMSLRKLGVRKFYGDEFCTFDNAKWFYSFRRDGPTGRMLSFIYLQA